MQVFWTLRVHTSLGRFLSNLGQKDYLLIRIDQGSQQCIVKGYCTLAWLTPDSRLDWRQFTMLEHGMCALCPQSIIFMTTCGLYTVWHCGHNKYLKSPRKEALVETLNHFSKLSWFCDSVTVWLCDSVTLWHLPSPHHGFTNSSQHKALVWCRYLQSSV